VELRKAYVYNKLDIIVKKTETFFSRNVSNASHVESGKIILPAPAEVTTYLQKLKLENIDIEDVYIIVKGFTETGVSMDSIIMLAKRSTCSIINAVDCLVNHEPPLIRIVGFKKLRYVATEFVTHWLLKSDDDQSYLNPLMWNDASGKLIQSVLDGCASAVISHILSHPGISHVSEFIWRIVYQTLLSLHYSRLIYANNLRDSLLNTSCILC
jgi:hypothetical protein